MHNDTVKLSINSMDEDGNPILTVNDPLVWPSNRVDVPGFLRDCIAHGAEQGIYFDAASFYLEVVEAAEHALRTNTDHKMNDVRDAWINLGQS